MPDCLVSLGTNLGDRQGTLQRAIEALFSLPEAGTLRCSEVHETVPVGGPAGQSGFSNAVVRFRSQSEPHELLSDLQRIEHACGRTRNERWAARTLDLDLLLYGDRVIRTPDLCVPHPRMTFRPFVLRPAVEVAGDWRHPEASASLAELLAALEASDGGLGILGDLQDEVSDLIAAERPDLDRDERSEQRLVIDASTDPHPLPPSGPRLVLADCPREHWRDEVLAALECVWPTAP